MLIAAAIGLVVGYFLGEWNGLRRLREKKSKNPGNEENYTVTFPDSNF